MERFWGKIKDEGHKIWSVLLSHALLPLQRHSFSEQVPFLLTLHPHKLSSTYNQTDFILTPQRFKSRFNKANTRSFLGVDISSDHDFVLTIIKCKSQRFKKSFHIRFDLENLKDPKMSEVFQAKIGRKFVALWVLDSDVDTLANKWKQTNV